MKKARKLPETSLDRYDWSNATRGRFAKRFPREAHAVVIDPDLWPRFGSADAVNEALHAAIAAAKAVRPAKSKRETCGIVVHGFRACATEGPEGADRRDPH
jgi:hypothetical protein